MAQIDIVNLIVVALAIAVAAAVPALLPRLPAPGVVLEIVIGVLAGPQVLGLVHPGVTLNFLASFGLGILFLMAGFEMEPGVLRGRPIRNAVMGWAISLAIALVAAGLLANAGLAPPPGLTAPAPGPPTPGAPMPGPPDAGGLGGA